MKYKNSMKLTIWILYWMPLISKCLGQRTNKSVIDCTNDELVTSIFNDPIDLTLRGIIKVYENVTINEILSTSNNEFELKYIDARLEVANLNETQNLILFTTEHFENYATEQTAARISLKINLGCGKGKERVVIFFQPLKEGNYFSPVFSKSFYDFIVPTPIFAGFDLTAFLEITAKDDDLTHNQISFTSNDSLQHYIIIGTKNVTSADKKTHYASLTLEKILLELPQAIEFEIVATDSGDPPKSTKASVIIRADPKRSLPPKPTFTQALYKGLIKLDFNMEPMQVRLSNGTYTPEVKFSLNGVGVKVFHLQDNKDGSVDIIWNPENMSRSDIIQHKTWELEVKAEHNSLTDVGIANILVDMADYKNNFKFMSSYYEGNIDEMGELHINPISFNYYTYQPDIEFTLQSLNDFFFLTIQNFSLQLQLNQSFTWQGVDDMGYLKLTLQALWENLSSVTHIVIKLPQIKNVTSKQMFQFEKPLYVGQLNETYDLELESIELKTNVLNPQEIEYNLSGKDSDQFYVVQNKNRIEIKANLDNLTKPELQLKTSYLMIVEAKHRDLNAFASVIINVPQVNKQLKKNVFPAHLVKGSVLIRNGSQQLSMESIAVTNDVREELHEFKFRLRGDYSVHFDVKANFTSQEINVVLKTPISSDILATKHLLNMTLQAQLPGSDGGFNDTLMVLIELPIKECPPSLTLRPNPLQFSSSSYIFTIYTNETGILGVVNAFSSGSNALIRYILGVENDLLAQRLSVNPFTGELTLYGGIEEGNYLFNITAENIVTHERAVAKALLKVQQREECTTIYEGVTVEKTLMILHVDEEKPNYGLLDMKFNENCTFHIVDMWPNDKEYVHVNYIFNILDAISIDREDEIFQNMSEPQVMVKLKLKCDKENSQRNLTIDIPKPEEERATEITFYQDIPYSPDIMWLYLKIDDINDNAPEFNISEGPIYLGYPSGNATLDIYPEYLTQIQAFDRDLGFNAEIKFTMKDNPYFDIEPKTGKIYPKDQALSENEQTELIILATDQYGEGLISRTVAVVKGLSSDFYSLVTFKAYSGKSKQQVEYELSQKTGFIINVLKMTYVPQVSQGRANLNQSLSCRAWIYAYDQQQLVTYKKIQEQLLVRNPEAAIVNMESYNEAAVCAPIHDNTNLVYLIATILLSLLSGSSLIFIICRCCYKPALTAKCDTKHSSVAASHNGNGQQQICAKCSHGFDNTRDCLECNNQHNHLVKFSDLADNGIVNEKSGELKIVIK